MVEQSAFQGDQGQDRDSTQQAVEAFREHVAQLAQKNIAQVMPAAEAVTQATQQTVQVVQDALQTDAFMAAPDSKLARFGIATQEGVGNLWSGVKNSWKEQGFTGVAENLLISGTMGAVLKTAMPEGGAVGKVAGAAIAGYFTLKQAEPLIDAYNHALNAQTMGDLHNAGRELGDIGGSLAIGLPVSIVGYKLGARGAERFLASERMDGFAEWKHNSYKKLDAKFSEWTKGKGSYSPIEETAGTIGLTPSPARAGRAILPDSARPAPLAEMRGQTELALPMEVEVTLRSKGSDFKVDRMLKRISEGRREPLNEAEYLQKFGVDPVAHAELQTFAAQHGLAISDANMLSGRMTLRGSVDQMQKAFDVKLNDYQGAGGNVFRGREGVVSVPNHLAPHVEGVFGLDSRPQFRTLYVKMPPELPPSGGGGTIGGTKVSGIVGPEAPAPTPRRAGSLTPEESFGAYRVNPEITGEGVNTAFISLGGTMAEGYEAAWKQAGLDPKKFKVVNTTGKDLKSDPSGANGENALDADIHKHGLPDGHLSMVAGENSDAGFIKAIDRATFPKKGDLPGDGQNSSVSISWGMNEEQWSAQGFKGMNAAFKRAALKGVSVTAAAGDDGAVDRAPSGKATTDYPASDPVVTAVGGTLLRINPDGTLKTETTWGPPASENGAGGGGRSLHWERPEYQQGVDMPNLRKTKFDGRGVPDISLNSAPESGWLVYTDEGMVAIGGTSAASPAAAVIAAKLGVELGKPVGFWNPALYKMGRTSPGAFNDVVTGTNDGYSATKGWDPATGWGSINYPNMLEAMKGGEPVGFRARTVQIGTAIRPGIGDSPLLLTVPVYRPRESSQL